MLKAFIINKRHAGRQRIAFFNENEFNPLPSPAERKCVRAASVRAYVVVLSYCRTVICGLCRAVLSKQRTMEGGEVAQAVSYAAALNMSLLRQRTARLVHSNLQMCERIQRDESTAPLKPFGSANAMPPDEPAVDIVLCAADCGGTVSIPAHAHSETALCHVRSRVSLFSYANPALLQRCTEEKRAEDAAKSRSTRPALRTVTVPRLSAEQIAYLQTTMSPW